MVNEDSPHLQRSLGLTSVILFGLAYMGPLIVIGVFGVIAVASDGASAGAMLLATIAILFTAFSYGRMANKFPIAGSAYTYSSRTLNPAIGFMVGWALLLDYLFIPLVIWLIGAEYLYAQFPIIPRAVWLILFIGLTTVINLLGIKVANRANFIIIAFQVLVLVFYFILAFRHILVDQGPSSLATVEPFLGVHHQLGPIASGAAIAAYVFLGFDAVTTLSEETRNPAKNISRAVVLVGVVGGVIFVAMAFLLGVILPGGDLANSATAGSDIAKTIGGDVFGAVFLAAIVAQQFNAGIPAQASSARLMYAMGRDGVFPRKFFAKVSPRFSTPSYNIILCGVVGLAALFMSLATSTSFINFGAFLGFTAVNVSVIAYYIRNRRREKLNPVFFIVFPVIGAAIDLYLWFSLDFLAHLVGGIWVAIGFIYLLALTRGFRRPTPTLNLAAAEQGASDSTEVAMEQPAHGQAEPEEAGGVHS